MLSFTFNNGEVPGASFKMIRFSPKKFKPGIFCYCGKPLNKQFKKMYTIFSSPEKMAGAQATASLMNAATIDWTAAAQKNISATAQVRGIPVQKILICLTWYPKARRGLISGLTRKNLHYK